MKKSTVLILILFSLAFTFSCRGMIGKVKTSLVTVKVSGHTAMLDIRPATLPEKTRRFLAQALSLPAAYAAIPSIVQDLRLTVSAADMATITATVNVVGLTDADFAVEVPNGTQRHFVVEGLDSSSIVQYSGEAYSDLIGDPVLLTINMAALSVADTTAPVFGGITSATVVSSTEVTLSWSPATDDITSPANIVYLIYQATSPSGEIYTNPTYTTAAGATSYTVTGLTPGTTYYFVVRARDEAGNIDSNTLERTNTTPDTIAPTFAGLSLVTNLSITSVQLSWSPATDTVTPQANIVYLIYQADTAGGENFATPTYTTAPGTTSYPITGLTLGNTYYFVVRARDAAGNIDSNTIEMTGYSLGTYVDASKGLNQTGCGTPAQPCQTITFALSQPTTTGYVLAAPGIYSSASVTPETFPLTLKTGMSLLCYGPNFSTVIDDSAGLSTTGIIINDSNGQGGTLISGCKVNTIGTAAAINDSGLMMLVINSSVNGVYPATTGIQFAANSAVFNSVVTGFPGGDGGGAGIRIMLQNALISGNTLTGNYNGIYVTTGSPVISGNTFSGNTSGIMIRDGSPTINNNTITNNGSGISPDTVPQSTVNPLIFANDISGNGNGIYLGYAAGTWTINGNTINNNASDGIYIDNTYSGLNTAGTISGNTISNNASYGIQIIPYNSVSIAITGNTINNNYTGIDVSTISSAVSLPSINYNNIFCNINFDLNTSTLGTIDATYNWWDHGPPTGHVQTCTPGAGFDLCWSQTGPTVLPSSGVASSSTCTVP